MPSPQQDLFETLSGKMSPGSSASKITPSAVSWAHLSDQMMPCHALAGAHGQTRVWLPGHGHGRLGGFSTLNISDCPNDGVGSSLSSILEEGPIPRRYFLSPRASAGIIRRALKRRKILPAPLLAALVKTAGIAPTTSP